MGSGLLRYGRLRRPQTAPPGSGAPTGASAAGHPRSGPFHAAEPCAAGRRARPGEAKLAQRPGAANRRLTAALPSRGPCRRPWTRPDSAPRAALQPVSRTGQQARCPWPRVLPWLTWHPVRQEYVCPAWHADRCSPAPPKASGSGDDRHRDASALPPMRGCRHGQPEAPLAVGRFAERATAPRRLVARGPRFRRDPHPHLGRSAGGRVVGARPRGARAPVAAGRSAAGVPLEPDARRPVAQDRHRGRVLRRILGTRDPGRAGSARDPRRSHLLPAHAAAA